MDTNYMEAPMNSLRRRIGVARHVLLGHPVAYRVSFVGPITFDGTQRKLQVIDCMGKQPGTP
jgi:hypothetical protein